MYHWDWERIDGMDLQELIIHSTDIVVFIPLFFLALCIKNLFESGIGTYAFIHIYMHACWLVGWLGDPVGHACSAGPCFRFLMAEVW